MTPSPITEPSHRITKLNPAAVSARPTAASATRFTAPRSRVGIAVSISRLKTSGGSTPTSDDSAMAAR
jgi:hypothetical protein